MGSQAPLTTCNNNNNNNNNNNMTEIAVTLRGLATSNEGDAYGL